MKAYFIIRDFFNEARFSRSTGLILRSYTINNVETLTNQFIADTQSVVSLNPFLDYDYCKAATDGTNPVGNTLNPNTFNPFAHSFKLLYNTINGFRRGLPTGTQSGADYGDTVLTFGVDVPAVMTAGGGLQKGAFFIDLDFSNSFQIYFDIVTSVIDGQVYETPQILRSYVIVWSKEKCSHDFYYLNASDQRRYNDDGYGFLSGITDAKSTDSPFLDFSQIPCGEVIPTCERKERTRSFALFVNIPPAAEEQTSIQECCYNAFVFATTEGNDYEKNDFTGFYHQKQIPNETADYVLINLETNEEYPLNDDTYGLYKNFGAIAENPNLKTFILSWRKVLQELGEGAYTVVKRVEIAGIEYEESDINYNLRVFTATRADKTVRIDAKMDGLMQRLGVDFKNTGFETSLRFGGFFGRREPKYEEDNIIYANFESTQISMQQTNEYTMQSNLLPYCMTSQVIDFILFANDIYMNDYNFNNHSRKYKKFPVKFADNKGTTYHNRTTKAILNLTFSEKTVDNIKRNY